MTGSLRWLAGALLGLVLCLPVFGQVRTPAAAPAAHDILVMLRAPPDHLRPGSGYAGGYGDAVSAKAGRRVAERVAQRYGFGLVGEGWRMPLLGVDCYVMRVPADEAVDAAVAKVSQDPMVSWSEPMNTFRAEDSGPPGAGDPLFAAQPAARIWPLADMHRIAQGRGVVVAVIDSKVQVNHPDLDGQFVANEDFVSGRPTGAERHGTGVAGVIAAKAGNGKGIAGVAPNARLMALRACWQTGTGAGAPTLCDSLSLAKAIHYAIDHKADVINLSLAGPPDRLLSELIAVARSRGITVVAAYDSTLPKGGFPASEPSVIAVANQTLPLFPPGVYGAPGEDVLTTQPGDKWFLVNGSSYAAAHVSGLIALVHEDHRALPRPVLVASRPDGGVVDACATLERTATPCACPCPRLAQNGAAVR